MSAERSKKKFLKLPTLGVGKEWLGKFIREHLRYPKEALENNIEGDVIVEYRVNEDGHVMEASVLHGIGHGCDQEALRLVKMLQHQGVKNRGVKVTTNNRMKIPFRIAKQKKSGVIKMTYAPAKKPVEKDTDRVVSKPGKVYTYTISMGNSR